MPVAVQRNFSDCSSYRAFMDTAVYNSTDIDGDACDVCSIAEVSLE